MKAAKEGEVKVEGAKRTRVVKGSVSVSASGEALIKYTGGGGDTVQIHPDLVDHFALYGFEQFFRQLIAKSDSVESLQAAVNEAALKIGAGEMPEVSKKRAAKGEGKGNVLARAVAEVHGVSVERATAWLDKQDRKAKLAVRHDPAIAAALARLQGKETSTVFSGLADSL